MTKPIILSNVSKIAEMDLCTACGTCYAFCPHDAITMNMNNDRGIFSPEIDSSKCVSCGICVQVCPGYVVNIRELNNVVFGRQPQSPIFGNFIKCYYGHSNVYNSRTSDYVTSGGMATHLLVSALENGIIDGALITRFSKEDPLKPEGFLATTASEIIMAAGSKYCSSPTNMGLKDILYKDGRFAVVGLPCHIHAIRKAQQLYPELKGKIVLTIGLFCAFVMSSQGIDVLLRKMNIQRNMIKRFAFRGHGWPGLMTIETNVGQIRRFPLMSNSNNVPFRGIAYKSYIPVFDSCLFTPWRCLFCQDHFNQLSDISLGDAWLREFRQSPVGLSLVVVRSKTGREIVQQAISCKTVKLAPIHFEKVIRSQADAVELKTKHLKVRFTLAERNGKVTPSCVVSENQTSSIGSYATNLIRLNALKLQKHAFAPAVFAALPTWCFRVYSGVLYVLDRLV